jgi:hypothetical protein
MNSVATQNTLELEISIEELEPRVAPMMDGGETVLPLPKHHLR